MCDKDVWKTYRHVSFPNLNKAPCRNASNHHGYIYQDFSPLLQSPWKLWLSSSWYQLHKPQNNPQPESQRQWITQVKGKDQRIIHSGAFPNYNSISDSLLGQI